MTITLQPLELPLVHGKPAHEFMTDAGKRLLGLLHDGALHVFRFQDGFAPVSRFALLDASTGAEVRYALSGCGHRLAGVAWDGVWEMLSEERGGECRQAAVFEDVYEAEIAAVRAAQWSVSGDVLWISREYWREAAQDNPSDIWNELLAFDGASLNLIGQVPLAGELESGHDMRCHPEHDIVGVDVSCGQDGTWLDLRKW